MLLLLCEYVKELLNNVFPPDHNLHSEKLKHELLIYLLLCY